MGKVLFSMVMSLDGFVNDRNGDVSRLYPDLAELRKTEMLQEMIKTTGGADTAQQCIQNGLLDEIRIGILPILLGEGLLLFEYLGNAPIELERIRVIESPTRTDLLFRVIKKEKA